MSKDINDRYEAIEEMRSGKVIEDSIDDYQSTMNIKELND